MSTQDGLSVREHDEMRDLVLAGTQRIRPAGAHRAQFAAAGVALVLVGAVTGGVITGALRDDGDPAPAVTPGPITPPVEDPQPTPAGAAEPPSATRIRAPVTAFGLSGDRVHRPRRVGGQRRLHRQASRSAERSGAELLDHVRRLSGPVPLARHGTEPARPDEPRPPGDGPPIVSDPAIGLAAQRERTPHFVRPDLTHLRDDLSRVARSIPLVQDLPAARVDPGLAQTSGRGDGRLLDGGLYVRGELGASRTFATTCRASPGR